MEALTFNINGGYLEGIVRGYRNSMLSSGNYQALTQCETLDDMRMQLSATDYGNFLANEPSPLTTSAISHRATQKLVGEFEYLRTNSTGSLSKFLDYLTYSYMIDNVILLITGTLHGRDTHELLDRCHPLGWFDTLPALCVATSVEELYRTVLVETPLSAYFRDCLSASELDDLNIEIIRNKLYKAYLEDFYQFTQTLNSTTAESMRDLLAFEADRRTINITINSFGTSLSKTERARLFPTIGKLYPAGNNALAKADELDQVKTIVESVPEYRRLFEDNNGSSASAGGNLSADLLEDKMFEQEVETRQSSVGGSHKGKKSMRERIADQEANSNALVMDDATRAALADAERRRRELLRESGSDEHKQLSSKKKRRLDKYIEAKLRKEEKARLLEKLAHTSNEIQDRTELVSAATLGTGRISKETDRIQKIGRTHPRATNSLSLADEDEADEDLDLRSNHSSMDREHIRTLPSQSENEVHDNEERQSRIEQAVKRFGQGDQSTDHHSPKVLGSALAIGQDGKPLAPVARKRKRKSLPNKSNMTIKERILANRGNKRHEASDDSDADSSEVDNENSDNSNALHVLDVDEAIQKSREKLAAARAWKKPAEDQNAQSDHETNSVDTDELLSEEEDTDEEQEAVLMHALRLRGMDLDWDESAGVSSNTNTKAISSPLEDCTADQSDTNSSQDQISEDSDATSEDRENSSENGDASEQQSFDTESSEESSEEETDEDTDQEDEEKPSVRWGLGESERTKAFKQWAMESMNLVRPDFDTDSQPLQPLGGRVDRVRDLGPQDGKIRGPLGRDIDSEKSRSAFTRHFYEEETHLRTLPSVVRHIDVKRDDNLQNARMALPVVSEEDAVIRIINENPVTVLCGETGSGKTTQVPQFLYEAAYAASGSANPGAIGITQPRRVAAVSMAKRVAHELDLDSQCVAHQIRYDATTGPRTKIKFMTDGVLLRELAHDLLLSKYSVIIVDEAHERSVNTDVLIGMLSRVVRLREQRWIEGGVGLNTPRPLRLVIMSATLRVGDFTQNQTLFSTPPPVIQIDARQHPVSIHFNRKTVQDYVTEAIRKTSKIHARLPPGGILVFVTGQQEIQTVCRKLQDRYGANAVASRQQSEVFAASRAPSARDVAIEAEEVELGMDTITEIDEPSDIEADSDALDTEDEADDSSNEEDDALPNLESSSAPMHILPLHSLLPSEKQQEVFKDPPPNTRLVVVATNVAETSITIPNIKYVVDTGRAKERHLDPRSQAQTYNITWISKASAAQRAGRAGRTGPGHCYRLYSSAVFEEIFSQFGVPEILRTPVEGIVLQMKAMNIDNVARFPFPSSPDRDALRRAERLLVHLGALEFAQAQMASGRKDIHASITSLGRVMALFPVLPRFAKLLAQGNQHGCLPYAIALVAALSVGEIFERIDISPLSDQEKDSNTAKEERRRIRTAYFQAMRTFDALGEGQSDAFRLLSAVGAYAYEAAKGTSSAFCQSHYLRRKAMEEIHQLRAQLGRIILTNLGGISEEESRRLLDPSLDMPDTKQCKVLQQLLTAIYVDRVAVRADIVNAPEAQDSLAMRGSKLASTRHVPYVALGVQGPVYVHMSSTFFHRSPPEWVVFGELHRGTPKIASTSDESTPPAKTWLKLLTRINPAWLPKLGRTLCSFSQPTEVQPSGAIKQLAESMRTAKKGEVARPERTILLTPRYGGSMEDGGAGQGLGWELPAVTAKQRFENGHWVTQA
ncbi:RNA helicase [Malassezia yamatoensis]|uniref:RNA helicase n=1 Tax=Malassezia yamatoensis TaxID=253288 RepID=A0AAJ5YZ53_9BASI|nr:RNA helicase [Malassezia yamatoensis]